MKNPHSLNELAELCHNTAQEHGFYNDLVKEHTVDALSRHMLIVSEVAEMSEAVRNPEIGHHIGKQNEMNTFSQEEEEAADIFIRLADYCAWRGIRLDEAVQAKMEFNKTRPMMHGKLA